MVKIDACTDLNEKLLQVVRRDSSNDTAIGLQAGQSRNWGSIPGRGKRPSFLHSVQTGSGAHTVSYPLRTRGCFPEDKTAVA
jgi:hypothetical protein